MRRRPSLPIVAIALAVIAAIAIASPVFGLSKPIKKAIQKEVAKQLPNATGPAGPPGSHGADAEPLAYGHFPGVDLGHNVSRIIAAAGGIHCIQVTGGRAPRNVVATLDTAGSGSLTDHIRASLDPDTIAARCSGLNPDTNLYIETTDSAGNGIHRDFYFTVN